MKKKYTIATVVKAINGHSWFARMREGIEKFGKDTGHMTFLTGPPKADKDRQVQVIQEVIAQGVDALCVVPYFPQALEIVLRMARGEGIVVISHEAANLRNVDYGIEPFDNTMYGKHLMEHLASYMGAQGDYAVLLSKLTVPSHSEWANAAITRQREKYPNMKLITRRIEDHDDPQHAYEAVTKLLTTYPKLRGIQGIGMMSSVGAGRAVEEMGVQEKVTVVGSGLVSACGQYLKSGAIKLISFWDPADAGYIMNTLAVMKLEGKQVLSGMDFGLSGYHNPTMVGNILYGSAWVDVTKHNMMEYNF